MTIHQTCPCSKYVHAPDMPRPNMFIVQIYSCTRHVHAPDMFMRQTCLDQTCSSSRHVRTPNMSMLQTCSCAIIIYAQYSNKANSSWKIHYFQNRLHGPLLLPSRFRTYSGVTIYRAPCCARLTHTRPIFQGLVPPSVHWTQSKQPLPNTICVFLATQRMPAPWPLLPRSHDQ